MANFSHGGTGGSFLEFTALPRWWANLFFVAAILVLPASANVPGLSYSAMPERASTISGQYDRRSRGGLEELTTDSSRVGIIQDGFGNVQASVANGTVSWSKANVSLYGPLQRYPVPALGVSPLKAEHLVWRGKWHDVTDLYYWGARPYNPQSGCFISADPLGHASTPSLYSAFRRNPAPYWDPDGRCGKNWVAKSDSIDVTGVGSFFEKSFFGAAGAIMQGIGSTPSVMDQAGQGMAQARQDTSQYEGGQAFLARSLMLPADFAFGTTKLVNDPVNTVAGMPEGFVNFGAKIGADVYNVGANPSVNTAFNLGEDALAVFGLATGVARGLTASGVTAPLEDFAPRSYLQITKGNQWASYYNSFAPGTARLNATIGGQTLFRAANSQGAAAFGEFASVERPSSPADAIRGNALDPVITANRASQLFQVTTRPGFSLQGIAGPQGAGYPGGFTQIFQTSRNGIPTWSSVAPVSY